MKNKQWTTIPVLKYVTIEPTLTFWETLGFKITYRQDRPYKYAAIEKGGCQLHFYHNKKTEVSTPDNGCLIIVNDIEDIYQEFSAHLKSKLGKVPLSGFPRISRMKPGQTRFTVTDPSGNAVILIQYGGKDEADYEGAEKKDLSNLGKAIALAIRLKDFKQDYAAAAKTLEHALKKSLEAVDKVEQAEALILLAELAELLNDQNTATPS